MAAKVCTVTGKRHKWAFVRNVSITRMSGNCGSSRLSGLYKCECGERKHGNYQPGAGDLRNIGPFSGVIVQGFE